MDETETITLVKSLQDNSKRLGISWDMTLATVTQPVPLVVHFDGDDSENDHGVENALNAVPLVGDRVYVLLTGDTNYATAFAQPKFYEATFKVLAARSSVTFIDIPPVRELSLTWTARSTNLAGAQNLRMQINNNGASVYNQNFTQQNNVALNPSVLATTFWQIGVITGATATANNFGGGKLTIAGWNAPHPNINQVHHSHMYESAPNSFSEWGGGLYFAAGPYTRIDLFCDAGNIEVNSEFTLIGVF